MTTAAIDVREPMPRLIGRDRDLHLLGEFVRHATARGGSMVVRGEPGAGKTSVLDAAAAAARSSGTRVLHAIGSEFEARVSFAGLSQVLSTAHAEMADADPRHRSALDAALGLVAAQLPSGESTTDATVHVLRRLSERSPILVVIDDLPWLDRASAVVLGSAAHALSSDPIAFLAAARPGAEGFFDTTGFERHQLPPLERSAAEILVDAAFPRLAPSIRTRLLEQGAGNPLALLELGSSFTEWQRAGVGSAPPRLPLSRRIQQVYEPRIRDLPSGVGHLLLIAALHDVADLRPVLVAASADSRLEVLAPAVRAELVDIDPTSSEVSFRHPLVRTTVVDLSTASERRRAHERLAAVLSDDVPRSTWHLADAALHPDESVAARLELLAQAVLVRGDAVGGISALLRASDLSPRLTERNRRMALAAYVGADVNGGMHRATELLGSLRSTGPGLGTSLEAAMAASYLLLNGHGDVDTAHRLLVGALDEHSLRADRDAAVTAEALHNLLEVCLYAAREDLWPAYYERLRLVDLDSFPTLALWAATVADPVRTAAAALPAMDAAIAALSSEEDPTKIERVATAAIYVDRVDDARPALWRAVEAARDDGTVTAGINALMLLTSDDFKRGHWDEGVAGVAEGLQWCDAYGYRLLRWPLRLAQGLILGARGHVDDAEAIADEIEKWALPRGALALRNYAWHVRTISALTRGDYNEAYDAAAAISTAGTLAPHQGHALWVAMDLVEAAVRSRRPAAARAHVDVLQATGVASLSSRLALQVAGAAALAGDDLDLFEAAVRVDEAERWPFDLARIRLAYGERLRRGRQTAPAREQLTAARASFTRLGAHPWIERADRELQATGPQRVPAATEPARTLTPQERSVASLAAAGWTNKQIADRLLLSPRTVGAHLSRVFTKLGVPSRAGLRDALGDAAPG